MKNTSYNKRTWLNNSQDSFFTGSVVCCAFKHTPPAFFVELADCESKTRIHAKYQDKEVSEEEFLKYKDKITILSKELNNYLNFLNSINLKDFNN